MKTIKLHSLHKLGKALLLPVLALFLVLFFAPKVYASIFSFNSKAKQEKQEKITLVGKVFDFNDKVIAGVLVSVKNSDNHSIMTDAEGKFLFVLNEPALVSFSKTGYNTLDYEFDQSDSTLVVMLCTASIDE